MRPTANAFGIDVSEIATRGIGMSAWMQRRWTIPISSRAQGPSSGFTSRAPIEASAILSDVKYWIRKKTPAITATATAPTPAAISTPTSTA